MKLFDGGGFFLFGIQDRKRKEQKQGVEMWQDINKHEKAEDNFKNMVARQELD